MIPNDMLSEFGLGWLDAEGGHADIVLSTRVRLARNLDGRRYAGRAAAADRQAVFEEVGAAVRRARPGRRGLVLRMDRISRLAQRLLHERRLVSAELLGEEAPQSAAGVAVLPEAAVSVMINEEDHVRLQRIASGFQLAGCWSTVDSLDDDLGAELHFAYHDEFGYLTSCPTNVGTGLRASVLLHLPGLVLTREIERTLRGVTQVGLTTRGFHGEGSDYMGNFFQVSNQTTLGQNEEDLVSHLEAIASTVIAKERQARQVLMRDAGGITEDKIWRAYGLLRYARSLGYEELLNLMSGVRLGVSLGLLPSPSLWTLNRIIILAQSAHLEESAQSELSPPERQAHRAQYVRRQLDGPEDAPTTDSGR